MNTDDLIFHKTAMMKGGYSLDNKDFQGLKRWYGILFQLTSAKHYLNMLMCQETIFGDLKNIYEGMALFSSFVLQYSKCFTSAGEGLAKLDAKQVFASSENDFKSHKRILEIRNNLIAHNGKIDLVLVSQGVKEQEDRFLVKHFITFSVPMNELSSFEVALDMATSHSIRAINKNLDSIGKKLGKIVLFDEI